MEKLILFTFLSIFVVKIEAQSELKEVQKTDPTQLPIFFCETCKDHSKKTEMTVLVNRFEADINDDRKGDSNVTNLYRRRVWKVVSRLPENYEIPSLQNRYLIQDELTNEVREVTSDQYFGTTEEVNYYYVFHLTNLDSKKLKPQTGLDNHIYVISYIRKIDPTDTEQAIVLSQ